MERLRILIIGGYGTFGGKLARLLADEARLVLIIAGRSHAKAAAFCGCLPFKAETVAATFDRNGDVAGQIEALRPDTVVDASGPFQSYGGDPYLVVRACLTLGIDYLDLADGSEFVDGIARFDDEARLREVCILSGASSFPVLTAAVVEALSPSFGRIDTVIGGIAPSPYAGVGLNVIRAIASYAGKSVPLVRKGRHAVGYALTEAMRYTIAPPGRLPLRNTRFSLVDVPDLRVLPALWPGLSTVWMGAGPVPGILHRVLSVLAWLVRLRLLPSLYPYVRIFHLAINILRWGEHRGGMFVRVEGLSGTGAPAVRSWHLIAEGDDGPLIPSMAIEGIIRHRLAGRRPAYGARAAAKELTLQDYDGLFARRAIETGVRDTPGGDRMPLYQRILGDAWWDLPAPIRALHTVEETVTADGIATITRGNGRLAHLVAAVFRFPQAGVDIPVTVKLDRQERAECWHRSFAGETFASLQSPGRGRSEWLVDETFGPFTFGLALVLESDRLRLVLRHWRCLGLPLPLWLAPTNDSYEFVADGRFHFCVKIGHRLTGPIIWYQGWLIPRSS